ncbi:hypothetical protein [Pelagibius sp.]|uniref:hypothetical protein n=1 Tax=Pelagibius sp. TaxID=1931238 RepID=UPI002627A3BC|nr:hypothetical protein [Pelagibius sp.]
MPPDARALRSVPKVLLKIAFLVVLIVAANIAADWIVEALSLEIRPRTEDRVHRMVMIAAVAYAVLIAIPFVPGVEIGLALIGLLGPAIVFLVYLCTLAGLLISFTVGRLVPLRGLIRLLDELSMRRASRLLAAIEPMTMDERLAFLASKAPNRALPFLLRHRYLALAVVINLPGNIVIGGGGGISLIAGASRLFSLPGFVATIALAVSPVPLAIFLLGKEVLPG